MIALVVIAPLAASLATWLPVGADLRRAIRIASAAGAALLSLLALRSFDPLSQLFVTLVTLLGLAATAFPAKTFAGGMRSEDFWSNRPVYFTLLGAFWSAMLLVVTATNFSTLWLGISATTLATAFLVGFSGEAAALEAAWKYLVLCSVGIALALLGIVVLAHVAMAVGAGAGSALSWTVIAEHAPRATPPLARLALGLMVIGFATKAGLAPMHAWLPDAHSKAPAPISGLLSGVLVSCALYALVRTLGVAEALGAAPFVHGMLTWLGVTSTLVAGLLMLAQRDLKRLLAYSTVEHAGIVALALGFGGPLGTFAALFHLAAHAFLKSGAFFATGLVQTERGTTSLAQLRGLWRSGVAGKLLLAALIGISGLPPFGLFLSELLVVAAGVAAHAWLALGLALCGMVLAFSALARTSVEIESGRTRTVGHERLSRLSIGAAVFVLCAALLVAGAPWTRFGQSLASLGPAAGAAR